MLRIRKTLPVYISSSSPKNCHIMEILVYRNGDYGLEIGN
jgi:hypothetical protein